MASTTQQIGGAIGLAALVAVMAARTPAGAADAVSAATTQGLRGAIFVAAAGIALTALAALGFAGPGTPARRASADRALTGRR